MDKKTIATIATIVGIVGAGAFYGGVKYGMGKNVLVREGGQFAAKPGNMQRNQNDKGQRMIVSDRQGAIGPDGSFSGGEIISKDEKSIIIKNRDGGSKIVYFSDTTSVGKEVSGSASDLATGQQVMISGEKNSDGSVTAQNIQIRTNQK